MFEEGVDNAYRPFLMLSDWLGHYLFDSISEVQDYASEWIWTYNHERPNMGLGGISPQTEIGPCCMTSTFNCG